MRLAHLIDLAVLMHSDRDLDSERLHRRDAVMGAAMDAGQLSDTDALKKWVLNRNQPHQNTGIKTSVGEQAVRLLQIIQFGLGLSGLLLGASAMASALAFDTHTNIIPLWSILVGSQIILLGLWVLAILPTRWVFWLPGAGATQQCIRLMGRIPMRIVIQLLRWCSPSIRNQLHGLGGELQQFGSRHGVLARWVGMQLTQIFALAFNLGMVLTFLALSYGNDPTFGWRSTMLSSTQMHKIMEIIALPWSSVWPATVPSLEVVSYVKDSSKDNIQLSLDPEQRMRDLRMWASLWPFLLASLCFYGVLPRILTLMLSLVQVQRYSSPGPNHSLAIRTLLNRLRRPRVVLESNSPEKSGPAGGESRFVPACDWQPTAPLPVFQWSGVLLDSAEVADRLRSSFGVEVAFCERVGELDPRQDEVALARLEKHNPVDRVVVLVEGWESPDADYADFFHRLRQCIAAGAEIAVVLYSPKDEPRSVDPAKIRDELAGAEKIWRAFLARSGDSNLSVTTMHNAKVPRSIDR